VIGSHREKPFTIENFVIEPNRQSFRIEGIEDGCQLSFPARTFAIAIPVTAMLVFNIVAVIRTTVAIREQNQVWAL